MKLIVFALGWLGWLVLAPAAEQGELLDETPLRDAFRQEVKSLLAAEKFDQLEALAAELRQTRPRWAGGFPKLADYYFGLDEWLLLAGVDPSRREPETLAQHWQAVQRWAAAKPNSFTALLAMAKGYLACARYRHGAITDCGQPAEARQRAEELLTKAGNLSERDAELYVTWMALADNRTTEPAEHERRYQQAIAIDPAYYRTYFRRASYLSRRGEPGAWAQFAEQAAAQTRATEGESLYARIVWSLAGEATSAGSFQLDEGLFARHQLSWPRLKAGFQDLMARYPGSLRTVSYFCRYACLAGDRETARALFQQLGDRRDTAAWRSEEQFDGWRQWAGLTAGLTPVKGATLQVAEFRPGRALSVAFAPDGKTLAAGYRGGWLGLWNPMTGQSNTFKRISHSPVGVVAFAPDGATLVSAACNECDPSIKGEVTFWNARTGERLATTGAVLPPVWTLAFAPDGKQVVIGGGIINGGTGDLRLWNLVADTETDVPLRMRNRVGAVAFAPNGRMLAVTSSRTLCLWDLPDAKPVSNVHTQKSHTAEIRAVAFSADGRRLVTAAAPAWADRNAAPGEIKLWRLDTPEPQAQLLPGSYGGILTVAFSPDGSLLAAGGYDGVVTLWDVARAEPLTRLVVNLESTQSVTFSPDGRMLAAGNDAGTIQLWDLTRTVTP